MPHARWLERSLLDGGLDVVVYPGWGERGSASFNPRGLVIHHTGPWSTVAGMVQLCIHGRSDLPGPLCQVVLAPDGVCHLIAAGRANHAGEGSWRGLRGNSMVLGIEAIHSGSRSAPWPAVQIDAYHRAAAALARGGAFGVDMICAHREWAPQRKIDPVGIDMGDFRRRVADILAPPPAAVLAPPRATHYPEDDMIRYDLEIALDDQGRGHLAAPLDVDPARVVSFVAHGSYPPVDGYWNTPVFGRQMRDGGTMVTATEGPPNTVAYVAMWVLE